jgi:DNA-binding transcriptional MerR regulator
MAIEDITGIYSIGAVAKMLGISAQTLRAWEDRYQQVVPVRSSGGQRLYSRGDVGRLRFVREQIDDGLQPAEAHRLLAERSGGQRSGGPDASGPRNREPGAFAVLLAERDLFAADFAARLLRERGYGVRIVLGAAEALQDLDRDPPDLVVVDLMISGGAGPQLCSAVRERGSTPVLAVSALDSPADALGVDAFLPKPLDAAGLLSTVHDLLGAGAHARERVRV